MRRLKITLAYDGTDYGGWQSQADGRTVQDEFEAALERVAGEFIRTVASGRTDAGVHAIGQVLHFSTTSTLSAEIFQKALHAELPRDIVVLNSEDVPEDFHAIRSAQRKRYRYAIDDGVLPDVFARRYAWRVFPQLDEEVMRRAAAALIGTHDFVSFQTGGSERLTTVRTVFEINIQRGRAGEGRAGFSTANLLHVEVEADGFLYNMVRNIVGTLASVGRKKQPEHWPAEVLAAKDRRAAGPTAPPQGLCLLRVMY